MLIIDDVITDGGAKRESIELIRAQGATPAAVLIALRPHGARKGRAVGGTGIAAGVCDTGDGDRDARRPPGNAGA